MNSLILVCKVALLCFSGWDILTDMLCACFYSVFLVKCVEGNVNFFICFSSFTIFFSWGCLKFWIIHLWHAISHVLWGFELFFLGEFAGFCVFFIAEVLWSLVSELLEFIFHFSLLSSCLFSHSSTIQLLEKKCYFLPFMGSSICLFVCFVLLVFHSRQKERKKTYLVCFLMQHITQDPPEWTLMWSLILVNRTLLILPMLNFSRARSQPRGARSMSLGGKVIPPILSTNRGWGFFPWTNVSD